MADAVPENEAIASVRRVGHKVGMVDDVALVAMLQGLLPQLLQMLATKQPGTRKALMDVLSHINKRVRGHKGLALPCAELLLLLRSDKRFGRS